MLKKFIIVSPPYIPKSAGIVCLHELCDALIRCGYEAHILIYDVRTNKAGYTRDARYYSSKLLRSEIPELNEKGCLLNILESGVTVYPEVVVGNPLNARNVVRYFLNSDGVLTGKKSDYSDNDFLLAYSKNFFKDAHAVLMKPIIGSEFTAAGSRPYGERALDCTYIGKGSKYSKCYRLNKTIEITREYPSTKQELSILLRNTRYFFSWDNVSATNADAVFCGARLVLMQDLPCTRQSLLETKFEFGHTPFLNGTVKGDQIIVEERSDYDELREKFISNLQGIVDAWPVEVASTAEKIFKHFALKQRQI